MRPRAGLFLHAEDDASPTVSSTQSDVGKQVMRTVPWWVLPWTYAALELVLYSRANNALWILDRNIYGNMGRSLLLRVHVWSAIFMWMLGGCQMSARFLRKSYPSLAEWIWLPRSMDARCGSKCCDLSLRGATLCSGRSPPSLLDVFLSFLFFLGVSRVGASRARTPSTCMASSWGWAAYARWRGLRRAIR